MRYKWTATSVSVFKWRTRIPVCAQYANVGGPAKCLQHANSSIYIPWKSIFTCSYIPIISMWKDGGGGGGGRISEGGRSDGGLQ